MHNFLHGVRVLELGHIVNGPLAGQILGDFGADVIKVEALDGDVYRHAGARRNPGMGAPWQAVNRNKRFLSVDLKADAGREILSRLVAQSDAMIHNMRVRAIERLGFGYQAVRTIKPGIVYAYSVGYGQAGPYKDYPAFDDLIQGYSGLAQANGDPEGRPRLVPMVVTDTVAGQMLAQSVMAGLFNRRQTGQGCCVEVPMFEVATTLLLSQHLNAQAFRPALGDYGYARVLSHHRGPCRTADGYIVHGAYQRKHWLAFLQAIGGQDNLLNGPLLTDEAAVARNIDELYRVMANEILPRRTTDAWRRVFDALDIPCAPVLGFDELDADPHLKQVGLFEDFEHPTEGPMRQMRLPLQIDGIASQTDRPPARLGQDSAQILAELGYNEADIGKLQRDGAIAMAA